VTVHAPSSGERVAARDPRLEVSMLWAVVVILLVFWLLGLVANVVGGLIHILLVLAIVVLIYQFVTGRRSA
jgi:Family of unknown function (DUF5670)